MQFEERETGRVEEGQTCLRGFGSEMGNGIEYWNRTRAQQQIGFLPFSPLDLADLIPWNLEISQLFVISGERQDENTYRTEGVAGLIPYYYFTPLCVLFLELLVLSGSIPFISVQLSAATETGRKLSLCSLSACLRTAVFSWNDLFLENFREFSRYKFDLHISLAYAGVLGIWRFSRKRRIFKSLKQ